MRENHRFLIQLFIMLSKISMIKNRIDRLSKTYNGFFGEDSICNIPFKFIYIYLFLVTFLCIALVNDYYYLYLIFIDCMIVLAFKHFYFEYGVTEECESKFVHEVVDNQWIWMLVLCCHIKFCFMTIKEEVLHLNYLV